MLLVSYGAPLTAGADVAPPPPTDAWRGTDFAVAITVPIASDRSFEPGIHAQLNGTERACSEELNGAIYRQDVLHAFESRAHFDNCAFDASVGYVQELLRDADAAFRSPSAGTRGGVPADVARGVRILGQIAHAIQDFYAHSNYVELMEASSVRPEKLKDIRRVRVWDINDTALAEARSNGLVSGRVFWSVPQLCAPSVPSHHDMAKDSSKTIAGKTASAWEGTDRFTVAFNMALRSTSDFLRWAAKRWPALERHCGEALAFIPVDDRRQVDQ